MDYYRELIDMGVDPERIDDANGDYKALYNTIMEECSEMNFPGNSLHTLSPDNYGVFAVKTRGSLHIWEVAKGEVHITRYQGPDSQSGLDSVHGIPYRANVRTWPEVGEFFFVDVMGGNPRLPDWMRSSRIRSIDRLL